jgi:hypothetical protein
MKHLALLSFFLAMTLLAGLPAHAQPVGAPHVMTPREMLFEPGTKDQFMALSKEERVESIGRVLELTDNEKKLRVSQISERAYKIEDCVSKHIGESAYKPKDVMTVISDCVVVLGYQ